MFSISPRRLRGCVLLGFIGLACRPGVTRQVIGKDDPTPLGVTAAQVIKSVAGHYSGVASWRGSDSDVSMTTSGTAGLEMDLICANGEIRLLSDTGNTIMEIDCNLRLFTSDGGLNDSLNATLSQTSNSAPPVLNAPSLVTDVDQSKLVGRFRATPVATSTAVTFGFLLTWTGPHSLSLDGHFSVGYSQMLEGNTITLGTPVASISAARIP